MKEGLRNMENKIRRCNTTRVGERGASNVEETIFYKVKPEDFPKLMKDIKMQIEKTQSTKWNNRK